MGEGRKRGMGGRKKERRWIHKAKEGMERESLVGRSREIREEKKE